MLASKKSIFICKLTIFCKKKADILFNSSEKQNFLTECIYQKGHTIFFVFSVEKGCDKKFISGGTT